MEKLNQAMSLKNNKLVSDKFQIGPFAVDGNNEFAIVFKDTSSFQIQVKFYQQPDSYEVSLLADYKNKCEFSTFLKSGEILIKILDRYMVFDQWGSFIYQVTFGDIDKEIEQDQID